MMKTIHWGIIGCGDVTEVKSGPALQKIPHSTIAAVMRRSGDKARDYAERHGVSRWYDDADALLHDNTVNAIYIATPPESHARYTIAALEMGKPVYVEKPMARTYAECLAMNAAAERTGVPLFVAYYRRRHTPYLAVRDWLGEQRIGDVRCVSVQMLYGPRPGDHDTPRPWRVRPEVSGAGHLYDLAAHQLDLLDYTVGPVAETQAFAANQAGWYPAEDVVAGAWRHENGVLGSGLWCYTAKPSPRVERTEITGSEGRITYTTFGQQRATLETHASIEVVDLERPAHVQQPLLETVVAALRGEGACPSTGVTAARTSRLLEALVADYYATEAP
ncbi:MAG: Gfo/Idh/MocA family oxidoreductase [Rhodothermales bacterium]